MPTKRNLTGKQFGPKVKELLELVKTNDDWKTYVTDDTILLIETLIKNMNMTDTLEELNLKYITARARILNAIYRIENKKTDYMRNGKSEKAKELFSLVNDPEIEINNILSPKEIEIVYLFKKHKNLYKIGRIKNMAPSNISKILYGDTQVTGIVKKLKSYKR